MLVSNYPSHFNPVSGIFYKRMVDALIQQDVDFLIIAPRPLFKETLSRYRTGRQIKRANSVSRNRYELNNPRILRPYYIPIPWKSFRKLLFRQLRFVISRSIAKNKMQFDLIDARGAYPWCAIGLELSFKAKKPIISTFIGSDINVLIFQSNWIKGVVRRVVRHSAVVSVVSQDLKRTVSKEFGRRDLQVIYDSFDLSEFKKHKKSLKKQNNERPNQPVFGFVGSLSLMKGCDVLLELIKAYKNKVSWIIVGSGEYGRIIGKQANVRLMGNLDPERVLELYSEMDLFVFPSKSEGIPNVIKEAAYFELPIVASEAGGIPEVMGNGRFGQTVEDYDNPQAFANAIDSILQNWDYYQSLAIQHGSYVEKKFDVISSANRLFKQYSSMTEAS